MCKPVAGMCVRDFKEGWARLILWNFDTHTHTHTRSSATALLLRILVSACWVAGTVVDGVRLLPTHSGHPLHDVTID